MTYAGCRAWPVSVAKTRPVSTQRGPAATRSRGYWTKCASSAATAAAYGSISFDTDDYIIVAKRTKDSVSREQADAFAKKVKRKGKNALGLIISINDLSEPARTTYSEGTCFMTLSGSDLFAILEGRIPLDDSLRRKKRHANDTGSCHFPVSEMF